MTLLLLIPLAMVGGLALVFLDLLVRRTVVGAWLILGLVVLQALLDEQLTSITVAGFRISVTDVGFSLLALAAVLRLIRTRISREQVLLVFLGALITVSLLLGVMTGPIDSAVNEFRGYLAFAGAALYFSTISPDRESRESIVEAWLWAGIAMSAVVVLRWMGRITGVDLGVFDATYDAAIRVLQGPEALFVASAAVILLLSGIQGAVANPKLYKRAGIILLIIAVVLNRRTVWLALAVALIGLLVRERRIGQKAATVAILGVAIFTLLVPVFSEASEQERTARGAVEVGTLLWRIEGWADLLESGPEEPADYVIGLPFGSGYERSIGGNIKESNPHNFYIQTFLRTGAVGLALLCLLLWWTFASLWKRQPDQSMPLSQTVLVILLMMQAVWFVAWPPGAEQGVILGVAAAVAGRNYKAQKVSTPLDAEATTMG